MYCHPCRTVPPVPSRAGPSPIRGRISSRYQRRIRSSPSSIGTQQGRGPEIFTSLPNRTYSFPNVPGRVELVHRVLQPAAERSLDLRGLVRRQERVEVLNACT